MSSIGDAFQITLPSNVSTNLFTSNLPNDYRTKLARRIELHAVEQWEVALMDIQFPQNWANVIESLEMAFFVWVEIEDMKEFWNYPREPFTDVYRFSGEASIVDDTVKFTEALNKVKSVYLAKLSENEVSSTAAKEGKKLLFLARFIIPQGQYKSINELGEFIVDRFTAYVMKPWLPFLKEGKKAPRLVFDYNRFTGRAQFTTTDSEWKISIMVVNRYVMDMIFGFDLSEEITEETLLKAGLEGEISASISRSKRNIVSEDKAAASEDVENDDDSLEISDKSAVSPTPESDEVGIDEEESQPLPSSLTGTSEQINEADQIQVSENIPETKKKFKTFAYVYEIPLISSRQAALEILSSL